jgi:hypothetical protein
MWRSGEGRTCKSGKKTPKIFFSAKSNLTLHVLEANEHEQGVRLSVVFADVEWDGECLSRE